MRVSLYKLLLGMALAGSAWTQGLSTINGTVTDPSGAIVPGAKITLTELDTSLSRETVTSPEGLFVVSALRPTRYTLLAEGSGFRNFSQTGITLQADNTVTDPIYFDSVPRIIWNHGAKYQSGRICKGVESGLAGR